MVRPANTIVAALLAYASRLRFPVLAAVTAALFLFDLVLPDALPFADEIVLGFAAVLLGTWRKRRAGAPEDSGGD
jgi:hypothetical protein